MFIGHFGIGFGAKSAARPLSLGTLFLAAQWLDLLWPTLLLLGLESVVIAPGITKLVPLDFTHYPISHSLLLVLGWSLLFAAISFGIRRSARASLVCAGLVASHWILDAVTHRPDLPLFPGSSTQIGLGLWNSPLAAIAIESILFFGGLSLYLRNTEALNRIGILGLWSLVGFLVLVYLGNLFGPPPPSSTAIAWVGQTQWLLVAWGYWVDRHRRSRVRATAGGLPFDSGSL